MLTLQALRLPGGERNTLPAGCLPPALRRTRRRHIRPHVRHLLLPNQAAVGIGQLAHQIRFRLEDGALVPLRAERRV